jgi:peptidylprolyl isomerase
MRILLLGLVLAGCASSPPPAPEAKPLGDLLAASQPSEWRRPDPENTLYMDLPSGRIVIELAPAYAPLNVANIKRLVRHKYFDGLSVYRVQDNFVAQWGDPDEKKDLGGAPKKVAPEFTRAPGADVDFVALPDRDAYAPETGFSQGFPAARDRAAGRAWLTHCYGTLGVGRDNDADSGNGAELYVVIGNAPRILDRNITVAGRVIRGIELLSSMPRGGANMGYYEKPEQRTPIRQVRMAADLPESERVALEVLRTDSPTFGAIVEGRRFRKDAWYKEAAGAVDVCALTVPVRAPK